jgi:aminoacrylate hydrolase
MSADSSKAAPVNFDVPTSDGAILRASAEGQGASLLLISGLGGTAAFWDHSASILADTFCVIRFDQRGIGGSTRGMAACSIDQLAQDCLAVLDAAGVERVTLLGHSTGGCIGQSMARQAPDRLDGLVLSATWLKPSRYMRALFDTRRALLDQNPSAYASTATLLAYPPDWLEANWVVYEAAMSKAPIGAEARQVVRERINALLAFDGSADIASLATPALILGARDDVVVPAFLQAELAGAMPAASMTMLEFGGHFFPVSRPAEFTKTVTEWAGTLG